MSKLVGRKVKVVQGRYRALFPLHHEYHGKVGIVVEDKDNIASGVFKDCLPVVLEESRKPLPFFLDELRYLNNKEVKL